jgi:hypothetical protein
MCLWERVEVEVEIRGTGFREGGNGDDDDSDAEGRNVDRVRQLVYASRRSSGRARGCTIPDLVLGCLVQPPRFRSISCACSTLATSHPKDMRGLLRLTFALAFRCCAVDVPRLSEPGRQEFRSLSESNSRSHLPSLFSIALYRQCPHSLMVCRGDVRCKVKGSRTSAKLPRLPQTGPGIHPIDLRQGDLRFEIFFFVGSS